MRKIERNVVWHVERKENVNLVKLQFNILKHYFVLKVKTSNNFITITSTNFFSLFLSNSEKIKK